MGTHLRVLTESSQIDNHMAGFRWFSKYICVLVLRTKVAATPTKWVPSPRDDCFPPTSRNFTCIAKNDAPNLSKIWFLF